jgi:hypothetical protein
VHIQSAFEDRASSGKLLLLQLPLGILQPVCETYAIPTNIVLEFATLAPLVLLQLLEVLEALRRFLKCNFLPVDRLAQQLFG